MGHTKSLHLPGPFETFAFSCSIENLCFLWVNSNICFPEVIRNQCYFIGQSKYLHSLWLFEFFFYSFLLFFWLSLFKNMATFWTIQNVCLSLGKLKSLLFTVPFKHLRGLFDKSLGGSRIWLFPWSFKIFAFIWIWTANSDIRNTQLSQSKVRPIKRY